MPVVVTGAHLPLGRALVLALAERGVPDLRAVVRDRGGAAPLRAGGVRVAVSDLSDPLRFGAVLEGAHTVVHLDAGPGDGGGPLDTWAWLLEAAEDTGLRRIVTVLPHGAEVPPGDGRDVVVVRGEPPRSGETADSAMIRALVAADSRR
ncbi:NAD(P)H-binding protein [Yinghuangia sp. ASG 101]|uniref:NAD(P)H-binding protein n=1 Tax=Yinghuangia sp. ASG 101 TaxID=2896848 RepID=UPI001E2AF905|nr:NAD(P)H-binding protein [Yinghuangia sp. ASG 101]UGQ14204.1 NAD(P)H-binding protein [Yinghuangia sp. ASG 101]